MDAASADDPWVVFEDWFRTASDSVADLPEAMTLATVSADGRPSARVVLFKGIWNGGLTFFTNYGSKKAEDLAVNPVAALVFHWAALTRQVRIQGPVERLPTEQSDAYFASRPRGSQLGAWASTQSQPVASRAVLEGAFAEAERRFGSGPVPRPPSWGGYALIPTQFEFWSGRPDRLHDRIVFERPARDAGWTKLRLAP